MKLVLGIDIGTTGVRGAAFDTSTGSIVAEHAVPCPYESPRAGWAEADPEAWWSAACAIVRAIGAGAPLARVEAVGVTGQAPTAVLVDENGHSLRRAILWLDTRAEEEARATAAAFEGCGNRAHAYYLGPKLAWLARHEPDVVARARWVLPSNGFLVLRLAGVAVSDHSAAALAAPLYDARARAWKVGVDQRLLPPLSHAHEVVGAVGDEAARATGLRAGTPVVCGGGDFAASALGAGVIEEGEACLMLGTAGNLLVPTDAPRFDDRLINAHHVGAARWLSLGGTLCGAVIEHARATFAAGADHDALDREAAAVAPGADGLLLLPYLQGERTPVWNERARGVLFGLELAHGRGHVWRATLEGIALSFLHCARVAAEGGLAIREVVAANGAGKSALLRQILCDALGAPLAYAQRAGGTVAGAALLAALGAGLLPGPERARDWRGPLVRHAPDPRAHEAYLAAFDRRLALWGAVGPLFGG